MKEGEWYLNTTGSPKEEQRSKMAKSNELAFEKEQLREEARVNTQSFTEKRSELRNLTFLTQHLRKSLQTCDVKNNLDKLEGLLKASPTNACLSKVLEGLIYVLRQLLASSLDGENSIGSLYI